MVTYVVQTRLSGLEVYGGFWGSGFFGGLGLQGVIFRGVGFAGILDGWLVLSSLF